MNKKLYKVYKKQFKLLMKDVLKNKPFYLSGLQLLMNYLAFLQDNIILTEELRDEDGKLVNDKVLAIDVLQNAYSTYVLSLNAYNKLLKDNSCDKKIKEEKLQALAVATKSAWNLMFDIMKESMENWL